MADFVIQHLLQNLTGCVITGWKLLKMVAEVTFDVLFGGMHKTQ